MDPDWVDVFPIEHGDFPASYVSWSRRVRDLPPQIVLGLIFFAGLSDGSQGNITTCPQIIEAPAGGVPLRWFDGRMVQGSPRLGVSKGLKRPEKKRLFGDAIIGLFFLQSFMLSETSLQK